MCERVEMRGPDVQEGMWIEIIRRMETLYAQLADSQAEMEKRTQELVEAKELAENVIRSMSDAVVVVDSSGTVTLANDASERLFGVSHQELLGRPLSERVAEPAQGEWRWASLRRRVEHKGGFRGVETELRHRDGTRIPVEVSGSALRDRFGGVTGAVLVVRDLRELKRLQDELIQAAKMSSLGRLAAGVAHELNNPLGGILLYSDLLLEDTPGKDPRRDHALKIGELAARCREIVRALLDFARPAVSPVQTVDINTVLRNTLSVLEGQELFHNVKVQWHLADSLPALSGDLAQLQQAFTNLVINGVEAMAGKGVLRIKTASEPSGSGVVVRISDTGCGIPAEHRDRLFEPFFTTKESGTGLGLPITYAIVQRHNGDIEVESEVGKGTTFILTLRSMEGATEHAEHR
jgi:PAS domain S-box-containing protein